MELNLSMYLTNAISFENVDPSFPFPIIDQLINQKLQTIFFFEIPVRWRMRA